MYNIEAEIHQLTFHLVDKIVIAGYFSLHNALQDFGLILFDHMVHNFPILQNHCICLDRDF
jgi:hypothetical protein